MRLAAVFFALAIGVSAVSAQDIGLAIGAKPAAPTIEDLFVAATSRTDGEST